MRNTLLGTYILFKNVQLLLILNTECFRRKTSTTLEMNFKNLKCICAQHEVNQKYFLRNKCFENCEKISMNEFFFSHLVRSKGSKGSSVQVPKISGKTFH